MGCVISYSRENQKTKCLNTIWTKSSFLEFNFERREKLRIQDYKICTIQEVNLLEEFSNDQNLL